MSDFYELRLLLLINADYRRPIDTSLLNVLPKGEYYLVVRIAEASSAIGEPVISLNSTLKPEKTDNIEVGNDIIPSFNNTYGFSADSCLGDMHKHQSEIAHGDNMEIGLSFVVGIDLEKPDLGGIFLGIPYYHVVSGWNTILFQFHPQSDRQEANNIVFVIPATGSLILYSWENVPSNVENELTEKERWAKSFPECLKPYVDYCH